MFFDWHRDDLILNIRVQPASTEDRFADILGDQIKLRVTAPPVDGKANTHIIAFIARLFKVKKSAVEILSGSTGKNKRLKISRPKVIPAFIDDTQSDA